MPCEDTKAATSMTSQKKVKLDLPPGIPPLASLYLYISGSCNLACHHCWIDPEYQNNADEGQNVKLSFVKKAVRESKPLGLQTVKLTGGEPMVHPRFQEILKLLAREGMNIVIETNGTLIDKSLASFIKNTGKISFISISLDGAEAAIHDSLRGVEGSHQKALTGIKNLVDVGFHPQIICTLHKENVTQINPLLELAKKLGCGSVKFNHVQRVGRGESFARENGLEVDEIIKIYRFMEKEIFPSIKIPIHFDIPFAFRSIGRFLNSRISRCRVFNILGMLSTGDLSLCGIGVTVPDLIFGHISKDSVKEIWCESPGLKSLREKIPHQLDGICGQCLHKELCLGTCVANNYFRAKKTNAPYYFCENADNRNLFPSTRQKNRNFLNKEVKGGVA
jgi:SynChlorMet cassette radical SAM/SPASM protein ScmF